MIVKTRASLADRVGAAVKQRHPYTTPSIMVLPVDSVEPAYHAWLMQETAP